MGRRNRGAESEEETMSRLRLKYVQSFISAGGVYHYFRRRGSPRTPLPGLPGSHEFMTAYANALAAAPLAIGKDLRSKPGSVSLAVAEYYRSQAFRSLSGGTPQKWRALLERFREQYGHKPLASLPKEFITALLDPMPPHGARNWLKAVRHFIRWAEARKLIDHDPTWGIRIKVPKSDGHHTWSELEIDAFEAHHPIGSKARLALALGLYTGQRRSDVIRIGRQHIRDGVLAVRQQKTGTTLTIPLSRELETIIAASPTGHLTLLTTRTGKSYGGDDFTDQFRVWCDAAGLPRRCVFHGLRKAAARRLAEAGCTVHEIAAITGHVSIKEVERYTKGVDQARLARAAVAKSAAPEQSEAASVKPEPSQVSKPLKALAKN
jgi:integrase